MLAAGWLLFIHAENLLFLSGTAVMPMAARSADDLFDGTIRHEVPDIDRAVEEGIGDRLPRDGMKLDIDVRMVFG